MALSDAQQNTLKKVKEGRLKKYLPLVVIISVGVTLAVLITGFFTRHVNFAHTSLGAILICVAVVHFLLSLRKVQAGQVGAVIIWGKPYYEVRSGFVYVPWLIGELSIETATQVQRQIPDDPEFVDKSGDDKNPQHYVDTLTGEIKQKAQPIRVPTGSRESILAMIPEVINDSDSPTPDSPKLKEQKQKANTQLERIQARLKTREEEPKDPHQRDKRRQKKDPVAEEPLHMRLTLEVSGVYTFKILDYVSFLENIGSLEEVHRQLRDVFEAVMKEEFSRRTPALVIEDFPEINRRVVKEVRMLVGEELDPEDPRSNDPGFIPDHAWGISIVSFQLTDVDLTKGVNTSLRDSVAERFNLLKVKTQADGQRYMKEQLGAGDASAKRASLFAEADGAGKMAEIAKTPQGMEIARLRVRQETVQNARFSIVPAGDLNGLVAGAMETIQGIKESREPTPEEKVQDKPQRENSGRKDKEKKERSGGQGGKGQNPQPSNDPPPSGNPHLAGNQPTTNPPEENAGSGQNPSPESSENKEPTEGQGAESEKPSTAPENPPPTSEPENK